MNTDEHRDVTAADFPPDTIETYHDRITALAQAKVDAAAKRLQEALDAKNEAQRDLEQPVYTIRYSLMIHGIDFGDLHYTVPLVSDPGSYDPQVGFWEAFYPNGDQVPPPTSHPSRVELEERLILNFTPDTTHETTVRLAALVDVRERLWDLAYTHAAGDPDPAEPPTGRGPYDGTIGVALRYLHHAQADLRAHLNRKG